MDGPEFRWRLLRAASGQEDEAMLSTLRSDLRELNAQFDGGVEVDEDRPPRVCPACKEPIEDPTLPQHISSGCPALK